MGMIPYYLATEHYKKIKFIDLRGLVTKDISGCSFIVDSKPKSSSGILITTRYYLENQTQIMNVCLFPKADIIYDTGLINNSIDETDAVLTATGYVRYYAQYSQSSNLFSQYVGSAINR